MPMKNKSFFLLLVMAVGLFPVGWAQTSVVHRTTEMLGKYSVVREWTKDLSVVFALDNNDAKYFVLEDHSSNILSRARIPDYVRVTDFRILHDSVFFCGYYPYSGTVTKTGIVGHFDIHQVFNGGDVIHYSIIPPYAMYYGMKITEPRRMDVYEDGCTHIVFVGATEVPAGVGIRPATTVCDTWYDGSNWQFRYYINKAQDRIYTDVAANSTYVVAVGTDTTKTSCMVDVFYAVNNIINSQVFPGYVFNIDGSKPLGDVLVEDVAGPRFAVAYQSETAEGYGTTIHAFDIDVPSSALNIVTSRFVNHVPLGSPLVGWSATDLLYTGSGDLLFLQDTRLGFLSNVESVVFRAPVSALGTGVLDMYYAPSYRWHKIDRAISLYNTLSGGDSGGRLNIHHNQFPAMANCAIWKTVEYVDKRPGIVKKAIHWDSARDYFAPQSYTPIIDIVPIETKCIDD